MSTHYIEEAERLCDTVTIMSHGKAVAVGAPQRADRRARRAPRRSRSTARRRGWPRSSARPATAAGARGAPGTSVAVLHANGDGDLDGERRVTNLEDVFVLLTGEEIA